MFRLKPFYLFLIVTVFSVFFISACSSDVPTENGGGTEGDNNIVQDPSAISLQDPFSLLGIYSVEFYGKNAEAVNVPNKPSELRVGLNLSSAVGGVNAPEVLMVLNFDGKIIPFEKYVIDLSQMQGDLNSFILKTFENLGAKLIEDDKYGLYFTLDPSKNKQYGSLIGKGIITDGQYLQLKLKKQKNLVPDKGLTVSNNTNLNENLIEEVGFLQDNYNITKKEEFLLETFFAPAGTSSELKWETTNPDVAKVENGMVTILSNGNATITATAKNGKYATLNIKETVFNDFNLEKEDITLFMNTDGSNPQNYQIKILNIPDIIMETAQITYTATKGEQIVSVNKNGLVTAKSIGDDDITVSVNGKTKTLKVHVKEYPKGIVFEKFEYGVALNGNLKISPYYLGTTTEATASYKVEPEGILSIDNQGNVTPIKQGDVKVTATHTAGAQTYTAECKIGVYTPIDITNPETLKGTYEFIDFTSDSSALGGIVNVNVGTKNEGKYKNTVQRMIGEMALNYDGLNVSMITKIQMDSSKLESQSTVGDIDPKKEQLALTEYEPISYTGGQNTFGSTGTDKKGEVIQEGDMLVISQSFKKSIASVTVKTYLRKKSDTITTLENERYFDYMDFEKTKESNAKKHNLGTGSPAKEPYYSYGQIVYQ